jgi:hypothetical protein
MGWSLRSLGAAFIMGHPRSLFAQSHSLLITLKSPPSILTVPYPIPSQLIAPPNSHFPPPPLDGDGPEQDECEIWDLVKAKDWMQYQGAPPVPLSIKVSRTPGTPVLYTMIMDDGRVWGMHTVTRKAVSPSLRRNTIVWLTVQITPISSPLNTLPLSPAAPQSQSSSSKFTGVAINPPQPRKDPSTSGLQALGLYEREAEAAQSTADLDKAVTAAVNGKFGLIAVGTAG